ncbi:hypothetical protein AGMMS4952_22010 [Spirochaetia bacterium]|nr:hypothetical protein AGMMS4952_22010 [Spirochaetia bacterium]
MSRKEEFMTMHGRHPFFIHIDTAFARDGKLLAKKALQLLDGGAYGESQVAPVNLSVIWAAFPYKIDAIDLESKRIFTNGPYAGATVLIPENAGGYPRHHHHDGEGGHSEHWGGGHGHGPHHHGHGR